VCAPLLITVLSTRRVISDWLPRRRWNRIISISHFWSMSFSFCHGSGNEKRFFVF